MAVAAEIIPANEHDRMRAVRRYDVLDTPPDGAFDRIDIFSRQRSGELIACIVTPDILAQGNDASLRRPKRCRMNGARLDVDLLQRRHRRHRRHELLR